MAVGHTAPLVNPDVGPGTTNPPEPGQPSNCPSGSPYSGSGVAIGGSGGTPGSRYSGSGMGIGPSLRTRVRAPVGATTDRHL